MVHVPVDWQHCEREEAANSKCQCKQQSLLDTYLQESLIALHLMHAPLPVIDSSTIVCPCSSNPSLLQVKMVLRWSAPTH
jgi:hypothetical protein